MARLEVNGKGRRERRRWGRKRGKDAQETEREDLIILH